MFFFFSSRRRHTRCLSDWSSDVCSSDLACCRRVWDALSDTRSRAAVEMAEQYADERATEGALQAAYHDAERAANVARSEERRVGKECRCRWWPEREKKKIGASEDARRSQ